MIFWGMGICAACAWHRQCPLPDLRWRMITGQVGRPGARACIPCAGRITCKGASDAGLIPDGAAPITQSGRGCGEHRDRFRDRLGPQRRQCRHSAATGPDGGRDHRMRRLRGRYPRPCISWARIRPCPDPDARACPRGAGKASSISWCRISSSPRRRCWPMSCCRPRPAPEKTGTVTNTNRQVQMGRKAVEPPGEARRGLADHPGPREAPRARLAPTAIRARSIAEMARRLMPSLAAYLLATPRGREQWSPIRSMAPTCRGTRSFSPTPSPPPRTAARLVPADYRPLGRAAGRRLPLHADDGARSSSTGTPAP